MQKHKGRQYVGIDRCIQHDGGVDDCRTGAFEENPCVCFIEIAVTTADQPNQREIEDQQYQERGIDLPASM